MAAQLDIVFAERREVVVPEDTTHCGIILRHIQRYGSITTMEAYDLYKITTCGQRCTDLRRKGWPIDSVRETSHSGKSYCRYSMARAA